MTGAAYSMERRDAVDLAAAALMVMLTFSWGLNGVAAKIGNTGYNPLFLSMARSAIGGALVLADGAARVAIVSVDLLTVCERTTDRISAAVAERVGECEVLICCSHTHSGPISHADERVGAA